MTDLGERIEAARIRAGLNVSALARRAGVNRTHLYKIVDGSTVPSALTLSRVASALGVPVEWLETGETECVPWSDTAADGEALQGNPAANMVAWAEAVERRLERLERAMERLIKAKKGGGEE